MRINFFLEPSMARGTVAAARTSFDAVVPVAVARVLYERLRVLRAGWWVSFGVHRSAADVAAIDDLLRALAGCLHTYLTVRTPAEREGARPVSTFEELSDYFDTSFPGLSVVVTLALSLKSGTRSLTPGKAFRRLLAQDRGLGLAAKFVDDTSPNARHKTILDDVCFRGPPPPGADPPLWWCVPTRPPRAHAVDGCEREGCGHTRLPARRLCDAHWRQHHDE